MGGVAEQRNPPLAPVLDLLAVTEHPHAPRLDLTEQFQHMRMFAGEPFN
jgi:hypothetical protein